MRYSLLKYGHLEDLRDYIPQLETEERREILSDRRYDGRRSLFVGAIQLVWELPVFIFISDVPESKPSLKIFIFGGLSPSVIFSRVFPKALDRILIARNIPPTIAIACSKAIRLVIWITAAFFVCFAGLLIWLMGVRKVAPATGQDSRLVEARLP